MYPCFAEEVIWVGMCACYANKVVMLAGGGGGGGVPALPMRFEDK